MRHLALALLALTGCPEKRVSTPPNFKQVLTCSLTVPAGWRASSSVMPDHLFEALEWPEGQNPTGQSIIVKDEGERGVDGMVEVVKQRTKENLGDQPNFSLLDETKTPAGTMLWFASGEPVRHDGYFISNQHGRTVVALSLSAEPSEQQALTAAFTSLTCAKK